MTHTRTCHLQLHLATCHTLVFLPLFGDADSEFPLTTQPSPGNLGGEDATSPRSAEQHTSVSARSAPENGPENRPENGAGGVVGGKKAVAGAGRDADFDEILSSYLGGSFGREGGSLLMPLGGLRLLR